VAVVGESGAGKSTILSLLLRFATPRAGRILAGETDLADVSPDAWRDRIAWVPQRTHLFAGTIAENIRLGNPDATGAELRRAATLAGALPFIEDLPSGFDTPVGEGGEGLSGGERQRIALARAFLRDAPLVLLDEPTAHLDATTAAEIETVIARLSAGRTVMVVAHHPGLALAADRVLHVGGGLVLEQGAREFRQLAPVEVGAG
jgi:ATP-binding cassette subfamily C protein CydD